MAKRKTPKSKKGLFDRFDQLEDDQFLELRDAVGEYFGSNFTAEDDNGDNDDGGKEKNDRGNDGGWVTQFFGG